MYILSWRPIKHFFELSTWSGFQSVKSMKWLAKELVIYVAAKNTLFTHAIIYLHGLLNYFTVMIKIKISNESYTSKQDYSIYHFFVLCKLQTDIALVLSR